MSKLSNRINKIHGSPTFIMSKKVKELESEGIEIISFVLGEPDFDPPDIIKKAGIDAIYEGFHKYSPVSGFMDLKTSIINKFKRDNGLIYNTSQILVSTGAKQCIINVLLTILNEGDEVIISAPYWDSYLEMVHLANGVPKIIETCMENRYKITPTQLENSINSKTRIFIYSSPSNPTGSIYTKEELNDFVNILKKYPDIIIISDEIYEYINYTNEKHHSIAKFKDVYNQTVTVNGVSKAFAMTGWRIGFMAGPEWIISACNKIQGLVTSGANSIAQRATITALNSNPEIVKFMVDRYRKRRDLTIKLISEIKGFITIEPKGAFYIFINISYWIGKKLYGTKIHNASDLSFLILNKCYVATVTGKAFGMENNLRLSYATSEENIRDGLNRIKNLLNKQ